MRILIAAEGESDEVVAERLLRSLFLTAEIQSKRLPARGIGVVKRLVPDLVRAAHFGHFELLVLHFDLDDTLLDTQLDASESNRWREVRKEIDEVLVAVAGQGARSKPLQTVFMTPAQSTDAWLQWALMNLDGPKWEREDRHTLKRKLFGNPPRKLIEKATAYASRLIEQMKVCEKWPRSLRAFQNALDVAQQAIGRAQLS